LERGRRYPRDSYPRNFQNLKDGWLWNHEQGLFLALGCVRAHEAAMTADTRAPSFASSLAREKDTRFDVNQTYLPRSTELTYDWLRRANDPSLYRRKVLPRYGHIDTFMGRRAHLDTYPEVLEHLERSAS
jgi:hypothetical protein